MTREDILKLWDSSEDTAHGLNLGRFPGTFQQNITSIRRFL